ncbi:MAG: PAS domain S-box protein [Pseudomonadota bacterium]
MESSLDIRTLFTVFGAIALTLAAAMVYAAARQKTYSGFHLWTLAFVLNGAAMILLSLRHLLPDILTVVAANTLFLIHLMLIHRGILRFAGRTTSPAPDILLTAAVVILFFLFTFRHPDVSARIVVISLALMLVYLQIAWAVHRGGRSPSPVNNLLVMGTGLLSAAFFAARATVTLLLEGHLTDFMTAGTLHGFSVIVYGLADILLMIGLMTMNNQQMELALRDNERRYRLLFNQSPLGIVQVDRHGVIIDFNEAFSRILAVPADILQGINTIAQVENPEMNHAITDALAGRQGAFNGDYTSIISKKVISLRVLTQPIRAPEGDIAGAIGIFEDTTDRRRKEEALREKERLQGVLEMAGAVCHEMNQPLMAILGYVELLGLDTPGHEAVTNRLAKIIAQVERLKVISTKLMRIARYETKSYLEKTIIDIDRASDRK